ncbi:MAG: PRTRC system protein A [Variovorax paradoxus]|nr:MAG: PRTRC system protein A [Variovorax paradoxus]PZQ15174.1 MAG: PRTRC system protein A [Variovorax paradoxus]HVR51324.1 PRTRC system protein A [Pseudorhodoferax sp.]
MDPRDQALLATCPVVAVPRFSPLPAMANGQRVLVARNGWFLQTRLDWLDHIVALGSAVPAACLPYGEVVEHLRLAFGTLPVAQIEEFLAEARQSLPDESAAVLVYARSTGRLRLALCPPLQRSPLRIDYQRPALAADETVAVDLHTHGTGPAFWSAADDRDDQGICIAGVFGRLDQARPTACFRLVLNGWHLPLAGHPWLSEPPTTPGATGQSPRAFAWKWRQPWPQA